MKAPTKIKNSISKFSPGKIKVLVFDVDDTITRGTLGIKVDCFKTLFPDKLDLLQEAREKYEFTGKGDRYNIIAHVLGESQENCRYNELIVILADKFEGMIQDSIRERAIHPDDLEVLIRIKNNFPGPVYILSATPQDSVRNNVKYFESIYPKLEGMFTKVIGNPMEGGKAGELLKIAVANNLNTSELVMIGDGGSDYNGAKESGSQFIGIMPEPTLAKWTDEQFPKLRSISELSYFKTKQ